MSLQRFKRDVVCVAEGDSARYVAKRLLEAHVGCAVVTRAGIPVGVITDRDLALRVVANGLDPETTKVSSIVTYDPICVDEDAEIETAVALVRARNVRRLPVVDREGKLVGIVTVDDLLVMLGREVSGLCEGIASNADANESR